MTTTELIEALQAISYNLNEWDFPITAREDLAEAFKRLKQYENTLKSIRKHMETVAKGEFCLSAVWQMADIALKGDGA